MHFVGRRTPPYLSFLAGKEYAAYVDSFCVLNEGTFSYKIQTSDGIKKDPGVAQYKCAMSLYPAAQLKTSRKKSNENNDKNAQFCDANPHQNLIK